MTYFAPLLLLLVVAAVVVNDSSAQDKFNGLSMSLGNLSRLSKAKTRSISAENFTGEKGKGGMATTGTGEQAARDLGKGWKISPSVRIESGRNLHAGGDQRTRRDPAHLDDTVGKLALSRSSGSTGTTRTSHRSSRPSVISSRCGWGTYSQLSSLPVCVNPGSAFNCYWEMPFRKRCKITMENIGEER